MLFKTMYYYLQSYIIQLHLRKFIPIFIHVTKQRFILPNNKYCNECLGLNVLHIFAY